MNKPTPKQPGRIWEILLCVLIAVLFAGGVMGLLKDLVSGMGKLSFRALLGFSLATASPPVYEVVYGIVMASLELIAASCLLIRHPWSFHLAGAVITLNMAGCVFALVLGDSFSVVSLLLRAFGLYVICKNKTAFK